MNIAIMQPYFFPYIAYFQLINEVDTFVFYNDVQFRKNSWFHRNRISPYSSEEEFIYIGLKLKKHNSKSNINEITLDNGIVWKKKFLKKLKFSYKFNSQLNSIYNYLEDILRNDVLTLSEFNIKTLKYVSNLLNIKDKVFINSNELGNSIYSGVERIVHTCKLLEADKYLNLIGGRDLYDKDYFSNNGIELKFLETKESPLFNSYYSILDLLLKNKKETAVNHLKEFSLT